MALGVAETCMCGGGTRNEGGQVHACHRHAPASPRFTGQAEVQAVRRVCGGETMRPCGGAVGGAHAEGLWWGVMLGGVGAMLSPARARVGSLDDDA